MKIVVDAMGGDFAPKVNVDGAIDALREYPDMDIILVGPQALVEETISAYGDAEALGRVRERLTVVDAPEVITTEEHPVMALRRKKNSTFVVGMDIVRRKEAQAFVSAGSTGALMAGAMFKIGRIKGIERPALATVLPGQKGPVMFLDVGANVDCQPKYLAAFGLMGSAYMKGVLGIENPRVGLANIGVEAEKGNRLAKEARELMLRQKGYCFAGNVEARDFTSGEYQVIVFDGFDGNLILKYTEGVVSTFSGMLKEEFTRNLRSKIGAMLLLPGLKRFKARMDYREYGGAPLLGVDGAVIKAHGASDAKAVCSAIRQARTMLENDVVGKIRQGVGKMAQDENEGGNNNG